MSTQSFPVMSRALVLATLAYAARTPPRQRPLWLAGVTLSIAILLSLTLRFL